MVDNLVEDKKIYHDIRRLSIDFTNFFISMTDPIPSSNPNRYHIITKCSFNLNKISLIKINEDKFLFGSIDNTDKIKIKLIIVETNNYDIIDSSILIFNINKKAKITLTLFTYHLSRIINYFGKIFIDSIDNNLKYAYLNLNKMLT